MAIARYQGTDTLRHAVLQVSRDQTAIQQRTICCEHGQRTRISLERLCWQTLDEIAQSSALPLEDICQAAFAAFPDQPLTSALWSYALQRLREDC